MNVKYMIHSKYGKQMFIFSKISEFTNYRNDETGLQEIVSLYNLFLNGWKFI